MPRPNLNSAKKGLSTKSRLNIKFLDEVAKTKERITRLLAQNKFNEVQMIERRLKAKQDKLKSDSDGRIKSRKSKPKE
ncbi:MAG: hypothetical protein WC915_00650 [archaeon]|jgi:hypothetical protein